MADRKLLGPFDGDQRLRRSPSAQSPCRCVLMTKVQSGFIAKPRLMMTGVPSPTGSPPAPTRRVGTIEGAARTTVRTARPRAAKRGARSHPLRCSVFALTDRLAVLPRTQVLALLKRRLEGPLRWLLSALAVAWLVSKNSAISRTVQAVLSPSLANYIGLSHSPIYSGICRRALSFARYLELAKNSPKPSRRFSPESPRRFVRTMPSIDEHLDGLALPPSAAAETGRTNNDGLTVEGADEDALQPRQ